MLTATCHCGALKVHAPRKPQTITACNCSLCRRYGTLWAYYKSDTVQVEGDDDAKDFYAWGERVLHFMRCRHCGCVMTWSRVVPLAGARMGVNMRMVDPAALGGVRLRRLDGADTWRYID